jgi:hypothetical protein
LSDGSRCHETEPDDREEVGISRQESKNYFGTENCGNSDCDISQETENSMEISTSRRQPDVISTREGRENSSEETKAERKSEELDVTSRQSRVTSTKDERQRRSMKDRRTEGIGTSSCQATASSTKVERQRRSMKDRRTEKLGTSSRRATTSSTKVERQRRSIKDRRTEEISTFSRQATASSTAECPSKSLEAGLPTLYKSESCSDKHTEIACSSSRKRKRSLYRQDPDNISYSSDMPSEPQRKRVKLVHTSTESHSFLQKADSEIQQMDYKSEPENHEDGHEWEGISARESKDCSSTESGGNVDCNISKETENSEEVSTSRHRPDAVSTTEERDENSVEINISSGLAGTAFTAEVIEERSEEVCTSSGQAATSSKTEEREEISEEFGTSSVDVDATSTSEEGGRRSGEAATSSDQLDSASTIEKEERRRGEVGIYSHQLSAASTAEVGEASSSTSSEVVSSSTAMTSSDGKCPICWVMFTAEEVATPDICDHIFCVGCLEEWSTNSNTCPLDRHEFSVILVRRYSDGQVIRRIPLTPRTYRIQHNIILPHIMFCSLCGQNPGQQRMLFCLGCAHFYHAECLVSLMDSVPNEERFCPFCIIRSLVNAGR